MIAPFESSFLMSTTSAATRIICLHFVRYLSFSSSASFALTFFAFEADSGGSDALLSATSGSLSRTLTLCGASSVCFEDLRHFLLRESLLSRSLSSEYEESRGEAVVARPAARGAATPRATRMTFPRGRLGSLRRVGGIAGAGHVELGCWVVGVRGQDALRAQTVDTLRRVFMRVRLRCYHPNPAIM